MVTTCGYIVGNFAHMRKRIGAGLVGTQIHFLREWRIFRDMTQEELAERANTTKASISRIENKKQRLTDDSAVIFARILLTHPEVLRTRPPNEGDSFVPGPIPPTLRPRR